MIGRDLLRAALTRHLETGVLLGEAAGVHGVSAGLTGPNVLRTPLSEGAAVGMAVGLAMGGRRPILELVDPAGLARAADALADLATLRARSGGAWTAPLVIRAPWSSDVAVPVGIPVVVAATAADLVGLLAHALAGDVPVVILEAVCALEDSGEADDVPGIGIATARRAGSLLTLLAAGDDLPVALAAAEGQDVEVIDLRAVQPLDLRTIGESVRKTGRCVVVGDAGPRALASLNAAVREAFLSFESPPTAVSADVAELERAIRDSIQY